MYGLQQSTAPASEPVTTAELKSHLRLNTTDEDSLLSGFISAARQMFEEMTNRQVNSATWKLYLDAWVIPIYLPRVPVTSVSSVTYYDTDDVEQTLSTSSYSVDLKREPGRVVPSTIFALAPYPILSYTVTPKITVTFVAGYTTVPPLIKQAILLQAATFYERRESLTEGSVSEIPLGFKAVVNLYKTGVITNMNFPQYPVWRGIE